jgi:hypothetical protein
MFQSLPASPERLFLLRQPAQAGKSGNKHQALVPDLSCSATFARPSIESRSDAAALSPFGHRLELRRFLV